MAVEVWGGGYGQRDTKLSSSAKKVRLNLPLVFFKGLEPLLTKESGAFTGTRNSISLDGCTVLVAWYKMLENIRHHTHFRPPNSAPHQDTTVQNHRTP